MQVAERSEFVLQYDDKIEKIRNFIFTLSNINTVFMDSSSNPSFDYGDNQLPEPLNQHLANVYEKFRFHEKKSKYDVLFHVSSFKLNFAAAELYDDTCYMGNIVIGPYLLEAPSTFMIDDILFQNNLSITLKHCFVQYYLALPVISASKAKIIAEFLAYSVSNFDNLCSHSPVFGNITYSATTHYPITSQTIQENTDLTMAEIGKRYEQENELISAVESGNLEKLDKIVNGNSFVLPNIPSRLPDNPLRSSKNMTIVLNTLLRKAAQNGGLPPVYLHSISRKFSILIEKTTSLQQLLNLGKDMTISYCTAVKEFSLKEFSPAIQKAITFIRTNLDQDLSLEAIAAHSLINSCELSRKFKKETGSTITEYINKQRIAEAVALLKNENISITDIAYRVGFNDINYFIRVFKKIEGITPSEYRKSKAKNEN